VDVEDTGVGIPPENLQKIFDLYFTTKEKGSGIGLSMVYRIVQLHDGEVEVQSTPGHGTRFRLDLRNLPADVARDVASPEHTERDGDHDADDDEDPADHQPHQEARNPDRERDRPEARP